MKSRYDGIPALAGVAQRINEDLDIPPFPENVDPETGMHRPPGWYLIGRYSGRHVIPVGKKKKTSNGRSRFGLLTKK
jgi:hypothetical protein